MPSANDDFQLRDGGDDLIKFRSKDVSVAQDGSKQFMRHLASPYPVDYGVGGCFQLTSKSGIMAAGLAANAPIYAFRWTSASFNALLRRIRLSAWSLGTGFTAGLASFDLYRATGWSAADTGGVTDTLSGHNGNLRTAAMSASALSELRHSSTATLSAGTRTLDSQPIETYPVGVGTGVNTPFLTRQIIFEKLNAEHPLLLAQNEGFVIQATVPATGTWTFAITPEWDEVPLVNY